jgi:hypothetical protein
MIRSFDEIDSRTLARYRQAPDEFIEECLVSPYNGQPYRLVDAERAFIKLAFQLDEDGRLRYPLLIYSAIKKSRKTELAGILTHTMLLLFGGTFAEALILANDMSQAINRCFTACCRIAEASPLLRRETKIMQDKILFPATQSSITAVASDYAGLAGGHPTISVHDELWGATSERARRVWDETIPVPSRKISCRLVTSHAGFEGEGHLLRELYQRGIKLPLVGDDLYAGDGMLMYWSHQPIQHWQDDKWLAQMRRELRPNQFARMIENRFVTSESAFIDPAAWDRIVDPKLGAVVADLFLPVFIGVDASTKRDSSAIVAVTFDQHSQKVRLVYHRIFQPSQTEPLDFELTIESTLLDLNRRFQIKKILFDPFQMQASAQRLAKQGVSNIEEFPQTLDRLTAMSQQLYDLVTGQALLAYQSDAIRLAVSRTIAAESTRGWRITKDKQSHKIDVVVALAMACFAAVRAQGESSFDLGYGWVDDVPIGSTADTVEQRKAKAKDEADSYYRARLNNYLRMHGAFGWP